MKLLKNPIVSQWSVYMDGLKFSSQNFYAFLKEAINEKGYPDVKFGSTRYREKRGPFSAQREYLRIERKGYYFDVCGFPFGESFVYSHRSFERFSLLHRIILQIPVMGKRIVLFLRKKTFQQEDEQAVFLSAVHSMIVELAKDQIKTNGLRSPAELEQAPIQYDLKGRRI